MRPITREKEESMKIKSTIVFVAALLVGCGATVRSSLVPGTNLNEYRSFSFYSAPARSAHPISVADQSIDDALRQSLLAKGYVEATNGNPDFLVAHHIKLQERTDFYDTGYGLYGFGGVEPYSYTEGTLIVDFIDPKTNKAFWRGTAADVVSNPSSPKPEKIQAAVSKLIDRYPANVAAAPRTNM